MKPNLHTYLIKLSDGSLKKIKANISIQSESGKVMSFYKGTMEEIQNRRLIFTAFNPISVQVLK